MGSQVRCEINPPCRNDVMRIDTNTVTIYLPCSENINKTHSSYQLLNKTYGINLYTVKIEVTSLVVTTIESWPGNYI